MLPSKYTFLITALTLMAAFVIAVQVWLYCFLNKPHRRRTHRPRLNLRVTSTSPPRAIGGSCRVPRTPSSRPPPRAHVELNTITHPPGLLTTPVLDITHKEKWHGDIGEAV